MHIIENSKGTKECGVESCLSCFPTTEFFFPQSSPLPVFNVFFSDIVMHKPGHVPPHTHTHYNLNAPLSFSLSTVSCKPFNTSKQMFTL